MTKRLAALILLAAVACNINTTPGSGEKIGQIVRLSREGIFNTTWEGQLIRGGMSNGSGSFGTTPFDFTVESDSLADLVQQYMQDQTEVVVKYRMEGFTCATKSGSNNHFLVSVAPAQRPGVH